MISNNIYTSALHKAVVNKNEDRYSLAYFVQVPDWDQIAPLPELVDQDHPAKYRPFTWPMYLENSFNNVTNALEHFTIVQWMSFLPDFIISHAPYFQNLREFLIY